MVLPVRMGKRMKRIVLIHPEMFTGDKDGSTCPKGDIAHPLTHSSGAHGRCRIVTRSRDDLHLLGKSEFTGHLRLQRAYHVVTLIEIRELISSDATELHHLFRPAAVFHIKKQHSGCI